MRGLPRSYLITLSALHSTDCGIVMPICFAVLRLNSNTMSRAWQKQYQLPGDYLSTGAAEALMPLRALVGYPTSSGCQHLGYADFLRERIDGRIGQLIDRLTTCTDVAGVPAQEFVEPRAPPWRGGYQQALVR